MEIEGRIINVLQKQEGTSNKTGNHWASQEYVIETHEQYPRKCCFRVFGEDRITAMNIQVGEELRVSFDVDAREYQGRWYNTLTAWKVERIDPAANQTYRPRSRCNNQRLHSESNQQRRLEMVPQTTSHSKLNVCRKV